MNIIFTFEFISFNYPDYFIKFTTDIKEIILYILALQLSKQIFLIQIHWFVGIASWKLPFLSSIGNKAAVMLVLEMDYYNYHN